MIRFLHKDVQMMMLRFRLKMLKTAILTALVFVDQKPKPPPPRSLLIFELQNSVCAPAAASARMRIYLSYTRRHILCRSHQNCSFPGGRPLLNDKLVVERGACLKKIHMHRQIGISSSVHQECFCFLQHTKHSSEKRGLWLMK